MIPNAHPSCHMSADCKGEKSETACECTTTIATACMCGKHRGDLRKGSFRALPGIVAEIAQHPRPGPLSVCLVHHCIAARLRFWMDLNSLNGGFAAEDGR